MYFNDHQPMHFHAAYGEYEILVRIDTLEIIEGKLPRRAQALVLEWASTHREELTHNWEKARRGETLAKIAPLD
jgi:hypothetical protein